MAQPHSSHSSAITSLVTLSGMTCSGKNSLAKKLTRSGFFGRVITATTRPPRALKSGHETHGIDYLFLSEEEFSRAEHEQEFLETTEFAQHRYGTPRSSLLHIVEKGLIPLAITDPEGAVHLKQKGRREGWDVLNVFLACDIRTAMERLQQRQERDSENDADYYRARIEALTCGESAWASRFPWDLTLQQFSEENFDWQLGLLLNSCRDGFKVAGNTALHALDQHG